MESNHTLLDLKSSRDKLKDDLKTMTKNLAEQNKILDQSRLENQKMKENEEKLMSDNITLEKQIRALHICVDKTTKQLENSESVRQDLNLKYEKLEKEVTDLNDKILQDELQLTNRIKESEAYIELENTVFELNDEIKTLTNVLQLPGTNEK